MYVLHKSTTPKLQVRDLSRHELHEAVRVNLLQVCRPLTLMLTDVIYIQ
jgi:hypothetical protein